MDIDFGSIEVKNNQSLHRFEVEVGGEVAELVYSQRGNVITFMHTGVPPAFEGHGIAGKLAHTALEEARSQKLTVYPTCPYVAAYIRRHPEYMDLLPPSEQARLKNS